MDIRYRSGLATVCFQLNDMKNQTQDIITKFTLVDGESKTIKMAEMNGRIIQPVTYIAKDDIGNIDEYSAEFQVHIELSGTFGDASLNQNGAAGFGGNVGTVMPMPIFNPQLVGGNYYMLFVGTAGRTIDVWVKWRLP